MIASRIEAVAQQNIGTAAVDFDFVDLHQFASCLIVPFRADRHIITVQNRVVAGTTNIDLIDAFVDENINALNPVLVPVPHETMRLRVFRESGAANPFQAKLFFSTAPFVRPLPNLLYEDRVSVTAGNTVTALDNVDDLLHSSIAISVASTQPGAVLLSWDLVVADIVDVEVITLAAAGTAFAEVPIAQGRFDIRIRNDGAATGTFDVVVRGLP